MSVKRLHLSCSRFKDNRCFGLHISGFCALPYLPRFLKQPRCQCCYGYIASKSDLSALNLYTVIQTFSTVGRRFKGILLQRVVNRQSLVQRRELSSGTPFRCLPSRYRPALPRLELHLLKYEYTGLTEMGRSLFRAVCSLQRSTGMCGEAIANVLTCAQYTASAASEFDNSVTTSFFINIKSCAYPFYSVY